MTEQIILKESETESYGKKEIPQYTSKPARREWNKKLILLEI
jgi:hypothetical protein